jgi:hypothetical protein
MRRQQFIEKEVEPSVYELFSWDLPGLKVSNPAVKNRKKQSLRVSSKRPSAF